MKLFKDTEGREWTVNVNVATIKRVRDLVDVDLLALADGELFAKLISDPVLLCDTVFAVCKPEADKKGIVDTDFGESMSGDTIEAATNALLEEIVNFCPSRQGRENLNRILTATNKTMAKVHEKIGEKIDTELDQLLENVIDSFGNAPES